MKENTPSIRKVSDKTLRKWDTRSMAGICLLCLAICFGWQHPVGSADAEANAAEIYAAFDVATQETDWDVDGINVLSENLLENGGFEVIGADGLPEGWGTDAYRLEPGYSVFSVTEENPAEGHTAACIRNIGDNDARFFQKVEVDPESLYRFSGKIRTENVSGGRGANLSVEGLYTFSESVYDTSDGWTEIIWYGETGENQDTVTLFARLGGYSGESTGKVWFDDLRLEEVDQVPGDEIAARWYQQKTLSFYDEEDDDEAEAGAASPMWPRLIMIALAYSCAAILLMQWVTRRNRESLLDRPGHRARLFFFLGLMIAMAVRMVLSCLMKGYQVDVGCFLSWGRTMAEHGPVGFYPETNFCDYPPAYTYVLGLNSLICQALGGNGGLSEGITNLIFRFVPEVCDLLSCLALEKFLREKEKHLNSLARYTGILLLAFHPVIILNSSCWGQMDSALALLILMVAIWAIEGKWELCLPCYMLAVLVKPQALMLGFLGLCAIIFCWIREKNARKKILQGVAYAILVMLVIVVPFSLRQDPFWIISQYAGTLGSYPYATVNTANFYYLMNGNWDAIGNTAPWRAGAVLAMLTAGYGAYAFYRFRGGRNRAGQAVPALWAEPVLSGLFAAAFVCFAISGASWALIGAAAMAFAFVIVLGCYLRRGQISFLPYLGGLLFLILYVFGIKMHERYIFPAFLLFALAYGLRRDRRILTVMIALCCTTFINEGIVLDNSIRLGSAMGHLNQDTKVLAMMLSAINCVNAVYAVRLGIEMALEHPARQGIRRILFQQPVSDNRLHWKKWDSLALAVILAVYSLICFGTLGSAKAPQTAWTSSEYTEQVILDLGESHENFTMLYFCRVSRYDFSVATSVDGESWEDETWAEMDQGQCWKWKYVTNSVLAADGQRSYSADRHWFGGRYIRITAHQINLALCEVLFRDGSGQILPIQAVERLEGDPESELYSDPGALCDEQDTMEGLPVWFRVSASASDGEDNPAIAQPSWWNSTYFDEIYHARTAWEFLTRSVPYETSHPPLGKVIMSWGVALFGMTPFGWRFAGALAGVIMLAAIYLTAKQMTKKTGLAALCCGLMALDCMHLTQTQIATIDSFPVLFILLAYFFMLRFLQTDWRTEKMQRILTDLGMSGLNMGLAIASKWIGIYAGAGLALLFFWHGIRLISASAPEGKNENKSALARFIVICLSCIGWFVLIPAAIYAVSYLPYFAYRHFSDIGAYFQALWNSQTGMFDYHSTPGLGMDHPFYSPWYEWPVIGKPMFYATKQYVYNDEIAFSIFCIGNPVIWWSGLAAMIGCGWMWIRNRWNLAEGLPRLNQEGQTQEVGLRGFRCAALDTNLIFLLGGLMAQYLPWTWVPRGTYIYHYFASVPFLILAIMLWAEQISGKWSKTGRVAIWVFVALAAGAFLLFFPYASGIFAPITWLDLGRGLLRIWY